VSVLPLVDGAVTSSQGVVLGVFQSAQDDFVLRSERNVEELVDLVPHLCGSDVVSGGFGVIASRPLDAGELFVSS